MRQLSNTFRLDNVNDLDDLPVGSVIYFELRNPLRSSIDLGRFKPGNFSEWLFEHNSFEDFALYAGKKPIYGSSKTHSIILPYDAQQNINVVHVLNERNLECAHGSLVAHINEFKSICIESVSSASSSYSDLFSLLEKSDLASVGWVSQ